MLFFQTGEGELMVLFRNIFIVFLGTLAIRARGAPEKPGTPHAPTVFVQQALETALSDLLSYPARVVPKINATLLSESEGVVTRIQATLGQKVTRNKRVLTIKHTDPVYQYAPVSVIAPVNGVVSSLDVNEGSRVVKGQKLATITDPEQIMINVEIASSDLNSILQGQMGELRLSSREQPIPVKVNGISPFVDPATGTASAELVVADVKSLPLPPGQVGRVVFRVREHRGIEVPEVAVIYKGRETFIRTVSDGRAKLIPVTLGSMRRGMVEVVKGLKSSDQVVVRSSVFVADGEEVTVQTEETSKFE